MKETDIQAQILQYLKIVSGLYWRNNNIPQRGRPFRGLKGSPDIIGMLPGGRFLGVEVKSPGGKQSVDQRAFQDKSDEMGGVYILADSFESFKEQFDNIACC